MTEHTERYLMDIIEIEKELLSGMLGGIAHCHALIRLDNRKKALIGIHGEEKYSEMLEELKFEIERN